MKKTFFAIALCAVFFAVSAYAAKTTRYWDACKPSCAWTGNAGGSPNGVATACGVNGSKLSDANARNACEGGGTAYTCMGQAPWAVNDNLAYGFTATNTNGACGKCFELTFTSGISGKKMIVMASNIGGDVGDQHFDLMIPGGGVGQFNALSTQIQQNGGSNSNLGQQYGGFRATCGPSESCIRKMCDDAFSSAALADLKKGCYWYIDWFKMADNPNANVTEVTCPAELVSSYKNGTGGGGGSVNPTPNTYTLTVNRNPTNGGTTNPASSQANINGGSQVNISATPASGYTFANWTVSGSGTLANAGSSSTTVTVNGNITVTANFTQNGQNPTPVRGDTIKVEAENYTSKVGDGMRVEAGAIGYIENGYSATYNNVTAGKAGTATLQFRIATEVQSTFTVEVNGTNVGTISQGSTGGWSNFQIVTLGNAVNLRAGANTIVLRFGSAVNVDYFLLIGDIKGTTSVKYGAAKASGRPSVTLRPAHGGFTALLPGNHGYTSYKLIDVLGREIRSGKIGIGVNELSVGSLNHSVFFLRLEGGGRTPTALKVVTY